MTRRGLLAGLLLCLSVSFAMARNGVVKTKDGRSIEGDVTDNGPDGVTITIGGGTIILPRSDVAAVSYAASVQEQYEQRLAALPKDAGASAHYDLARWLYDNKAYPQARKELEAALGIDPNFADAVTLRQTVDRTMALERTGVRQPAPGTRVGPTSRPTASSKERKLLDQDQINKIRLNELKDNDAVRVRFEKNVVNDYILYDPEVNRQQFLALPDFQKAVQILRGGTSEMRKSVVITSDPGAMTEFKRGVQPILLTGCSTTACHGGTSAGRLVLISPADTDAATYTNFYILTQFAMTITKSGDASSAVSRKAIDRLYPDNSLILQYGLPRDLAEFPHPEAMNWVAIYRAKDDPRYQGVLNWIRRGLVAVEPKYNIDFTPVEGTSPTTQPAAAHPPEKADAPPKPQPPAPSAQANQKPAAPPPNPNPRRPEAEQYPDQLKDVRDRTRTIRGF